MSRSSRRALSILPKTPMPGETFVEKLRSISVNKRTACGIFCLNIIFGQFCSTFYSNVKNEVRKNVQNIR